MSEHVAPKSAPGQLGISDVDVVAIRRARDPNLLLRFALLAVTMVSTFILGYALGRESEPGYPYVSIGLISLAGAGRRKVPWIFLVVLSILAFFSFALGYGVAAHPSYGEGSYYGVFSRRA